MTAVSAFLDAPAVYQNAPTFAYAIGEYRVDKAGTLTGQLGNIDGVQVRSALSSK